MLNPIKYVQTGLSVSTTELSLTGGTSSLQVRTEAGMIEVWAYVQSLAAGDVFQVAAYEKIAGAGGTQRKRILGVISDFQNGWWRSERFEVGIGWEVSIQKLAGTDRTVEASVRSAHDPTSVAAATIGAVSGAVGSVTGAVGSVTGLTPSRLDVNVSSRSAPGDAMGLSDGAITAAKIAANALTVAKFATDFFTGIADAVWHAAVAAYQAVGGFGELVSDIQSRASNLQSRTPAALVGGRMDSSVAAAGLASDAAQEVATAVRTELATELARVDVAISSRPSAQQIEDEVLNATRTAHLTPGTVGFDIALASAEAGGRVVRDDTDYTGENLDVGRVRVFNTRTNAAAATPGSNPSETGEIDRHLLNSTHSGDELESVVPAEDA